MKRLLLFTCISLICLPAFTACLKPPARLSQDQVLNIVWTALGPHTSTQDREYWLALEANRVPGRDIIDEFLVVNIGQCPGPDLPENQAIKPSSEYWYVKVAPSQQIVTLTQSASTSTSESFAPEPLIYQAVFLIDPSTGQIVARKLICKE
jgi:hypothetical protein